MKIKSIQIFVIMQYLNKDFLDLFISNINQLFKICKNCYPKVLLEKYKYKEKKEIKIRKHICPKK